MFRKLISNLPFQPTLLSDVAYYSHRLRQEHAVRRLGFALVLVGFGIQIFAVAFPPEASLATSTGDIIYGAASKQDVLNAFRNNRDQLGRADIKAIFQYYGIGETQIDKATTTTIKDNGVNYINTSRSTTKWADTFVPIEGTVDGGIYEFPLSYWRKNEYPNGYPALTGISTYGFRFWILLKGCGNIVYEKGTKKPRLEINKTLASGSSVNEGSEVAYDITFRNSGAIAAKDTIITDTLPDGFSYVSHKSTLDVNFNRSGQKLSWSLTQKDKALSPSSRWYQIHLIVRADTAASIKRCNVVKITSSNATGAEAKDGTCVTITKQTCPGTGLPIPAGGVTNCTIQCLDGSILPYNKACQTPQISCSNLDIAAGNSWNVRTFKTSVAAQPGGSIKEIIYYVNNTRVAIVVTPTTLNTYEYSYAFDKPGDYQIKSEVVAATGQVQVSQNCTKAESIIQPQSPEMMIVTDKQVSNSTKNIDDANNSYAQPGDTLLYRLFITNKGSVAVRDFAFNGEYAEDISDILEYANIIDLSDGALNKSTGKISWPSVTIEPGATITKTFIVEVKNPLPATPTSLSAPLSFDHEMHNKYGRTVIVKLPKPTSKIVEQTTGTLPNTGPTATLLLNFFVVSVVAYFYYRNKLLSKELRIIQNEFQTGGL